MPAYLPIYARLHALLWATPDLSVIVLTVPILLETTLTVLIRGTECQRVINIA